MKKNGMMVVFEGTDGSGKTTIIEGLKTCNQDLFPGGQAYYHWRPGFLKKEKRTGGVVTDPHGKKPYGRGKSFAKFLFFQFDYVLGYFFKVKRELRQGKLVVFDRYYYDYYMDKLRYRLCISDRVLDGFLWMIPKPDVTFLLLADPAVLYERKREIPIAEIEKQCDALRAIAKKVHHGCIVDVNEPAEVVISKVASTIQRTYEEKMR